MTIYNAIRDYAIDLHIEAVFTNPCRVCSAPPWHAVGYFRKADGVKAMRAYCAHCLSGSYGQAPRISWITGDIRKPPNIADYDLPIVCDNVSTNKRCARCRSNQGVQTHHWAPEKEFGRDSDNWPTSDLCIPCHKEWHRITGLGMPDGYSPPQDLAPWEDAA